MPVAKGSRKSLGDLLASRLIPARFLAAQLRRPSGRFGRWVLARGLNDGNAELIDALFEALRLGPGERFLDVGFGGGRALLVASEQTRGALFGADFSPDMVARGHRVFSHLCASGRLNLVTADVVDLPFRDGLVDVVGTTNTIYFWPNLDAALLELHRVLVPGGRIAFGYTGREKMTRFDNITRHGFRCFEPPDLEAPLEGAGFVDVETRALTGRDTQGDYVTMARRSD